MLSSEQEIDCEVTRNTKLTWSIFKFEDDPQMLNTVPTLTVRNLRKSVFRENIDSTELLISSRELPYGFYEFAARLEMMDLPDVFGTDVLYVEVVQTPWLEAAVTAGSFYTVPYGLLVNTLYIIQFCFSNTLVKLWLKAKRKTDMQN